MYFLAAPRRSVDADINQIMNVESKLGSQKMQYGYKGQLNAASLLKDGSISDL
ncbi:uncharacterized protein PHALS_13023 [Plasmopara halstedii]|uniref:Uncharacterized protein n=1 Tax=Plasmopara halstedii TaxID=4781 RepID=A0A0P1AP25_PLAHL|nr:uncharacterized protein PHALS_13023 [Plasmopara halstedii]CEG42774.1 hypothetical protein PHALS_13023 [Plasmopara halstedii]|eukprot:XP_024579143.1 hypothetical protein PHALS_13023 [Plasmopara halstedii]